MTHKTINKEHQTFDKDNFIRLMLSNVEYNSSNKERAKEYLIEEGLDPESIVAKGLARIKEMKLKLRGNESVEKPMARVQYFTKNRTWSHKSVIRLIQESENSDPINEIKKRARSLVLRAFEKGWQGPPYDPVQLAELLGIGIIPSDSVLDAQIVPQKRGYQIRYNPFQRPTRVNFSISHEIAHTLFSDCAESVRNRENEPMENRELEQLCNAAAAEIQLPYAVFSHDANAAEPTIEGLIALAKKYKASLESVFIRYAEVIDMPCAILIGIFQNEDRIIVDYHKTSRLFDLKIPDNLEIPKQSKAYECTTPGWTARERIEWIAFQGKPYNLFAVGISPYRRDKKPRVAMLILPTESYNLSPETGKISLEFGDATKPRGIGKKIICQVVNTSAALGRGFGYSLAKNYPIVKEELKKWQAKKSEFILGKSNLVKISNDIFVFQMLAQKGLFPKGGEIPLKYKELHKCLIELRETALELGCSIHMPAIGSGNAGGDWNIIIGMIHDELVNYELAVNIYLFQGKPFNPKEKTTLTLFKEDSTWEKGRS